MRKAGTSFDVVKEEVLNDEEFRIEYEKLRLRYEAIQQIVETRKTQNIIREETM